MNENVLSEGYGLKYKIVYMQSKVMDDRDLIHFFGTSLFNIF